MSLTYPFKYKKPSFMLWLNFVTVFKTKLQSVTTFCNGFIKAYPKPLQLPVTVWKIKFESVTAGCAHFKHADRQDSLFFRLYRHFSPRTNNVCLVQPVSVNKCRFEKQGTVAAPVYGNQPILNLYNSIFNNFNRVSKNRYQDISDKELLQRFGHTQDNTWLGILLQRYTLLLFGVCMKYLKNENDARDCVQQIFLKVIQEVPKYEVTYFKSWLYMVAKNQCLTLLRDRKGKIPVALTDAYSDEASEEAEIGDTGEKTIPGDLLPAALKELNAAQYECVTLFYLQKKSYQQISEITGYSLLKVKSNIQNGKRNLRINIEKKQKASELKK